MAARSRSGSGKSISDAPRSDAYTGLLLISLLAQIAGVVFFYLDWSMYPSSPPAKATPVNFSAVQPGGGGGLPPGGPVPQAGGVPMGGGAPMGGGVPMGGGAPIPGGNP